LKLHREIWEYLKYQNHLAPIRLPRHQWKSGSKSIESSEFVFLLSESEGSSQSEDFLKKIRHSIQPARVGLIFSKLSPDTMGSIQSQIEHLGAKAIVIFDSRTSFFEELKHLLGDELNPSTKSTSGSAEGKRLFFQSLPLDALENSPSEKARLWNFLKSAKARIENR